MNSLHRTLAYRRHGSPPQVYTGAVPFSDRHPAEATFAIISGKRPSRPIHPDLTEELWKLIQRCWYQDPYSRPEISEVFKVLSGE